MLTRSEYESYRKRLAGAAKASATDFGKLWTKLDQSDPASVRDSLIDMIPEIMEARGEEAGALAAKFYEDLRAETHPEYYRAQIAVFEDNAEIEEAIRALLDPLFRSGNTRLAMRNIRAMLEKSVLRQASKTIDMNATRDKKSSGCASIPSLGCKCTFCLSFAAMGFVFKGREHAKKHSGVWHDNCHCQLVPGFGSDPGFPWYNPERYGKLHDYLESGAITVQSGAAPLEKELDVGIFLADLGYPEVHFLTPSKSGRTADAYVDGILREIKVPEGSNDHVVDWKKNAENQLFHTLYNKKGELRPQANNLIISLHLVSESINPDEYIRYVKEAWSKEKYALLDTIWLTDGAGIIHNLKK